MRIVANNTYFKQPKDVNYCSAVIKSTLEELPEPSLWTVLSGKSKTDKIFGFLLAINVFAQVLFWGFYLGILYAHHKGTL